MAKHCGVCDNFVGLTGALAGRCQLMGMVDTFAGRDCTYFSSRENGKIKILRCPNCGTYMEKQDEWWKCPHCEGEWWPPEREDTPEQLARAARLAYMEDVRVGFFGFGGKYSSGSKSGKKRSKPPKFYRNPYLCC